MGRWKEAGLDCLDVEPGSCSVSAAAQRDGSVRVEAAWRLAPRFEAALEVADFANAGVSEVPRPASARAAPQGLWSKTLLQDDFKCTTASVDAVRANQKRRS